MSYKDDKDFQEFLAEFDKRIYRTLRKSPSLDSVLYIAYCEGYYRGTKETAEYVGEALRNEEYSAPKEDWMWKNYEV